MKRKASAEWKGKLKNGKGSITAASGAFTQLPYSFATRFGDQPGTNPEELIASAQASCFTMAVAFELEKLGIEAERLQTEATATLSQENSQWSVVAIHLELTGAAPGATQEQFEKAANSAKENCPISRLLNAQITLDLKFEASQRTSAA